MTVSAGHGVRIPHVMARDARSSRDSMGMAGQGWGLAGVIWRDPPRRTSPCEGPATPFCSTVKLSL